MDSHEVPNTIFCSKCGRPCALDEFEFNKQGKRNRTCKRHTKKRSLEVDDWRDFILCLQDWNKAVSYLSDLGRKVIANMLVTPIGATRDPR